MKRRDFIKDVTIGGFLFSFNPSLLAEANGPPDLTLVQGESPAQITKEAISLLGGMQRFVSKGDVVLVKPNIGWDRTPEQAACTNPEVVAALVTLCLESGAKEVNPLGDFCRGKKSRSQCSVAEQPPPEKNIP